MEMGEVVSNETNKKKGQLKMGFDINATYFLGNDGSGHTYLVLAEYRNEWGEWSDLDEQDEAKRETPSYAYLLNSHHSLIEFKIVKM